MLIRNIKSEDLQQWLPLWEGYNSFYKRTIDKEVTVTGSLQVYWMTHESNQNARILYDKIAKYSGFIVYSKRA